MPYYFQFICQLESKTDKHICLQSKDIHLNRLIIINIFFLQKLKINWKELAQTVTKTPNTTLYQQTTAKRNQLWIVKTSYTERSIHIMQEPHLLFITTKNRSNVWGDWRFPFTIYEFYKSFIVICLWLTTRPVCVD